MGNKFYALLLLATACLAHTALAQCSCGCMRSCGAAIPTATFATPPMPNAMAFPTHQLAGFLPQGFLSQYCQPQAYIPQGMLPSIYPPQTIVVPIPPPPKDCASANTTECHAGVPFNLGPNHPPIVVQTVYVDTSENPDQKEDKPKRNKSTPKKNRKGRRSNQQSIRVRRRLQRQRRLQQLAVMFARDPSDYTSEPYEDEMYSVPNSDRDYSDSYENWD